MSLIELLVALALTGVVMVPAAALMLQSYANEAAYRQQNTAQQNARRAADLVADDMKGAKRAAVLLTVGTIRATLPTDTVIGAGSATANIGNTAPLYFNIYDDNQLEKRVRYWLEGTNLRREIVAYVSEASTPGAPASATSGVVVARNVLTFTAWKPFVTTNDLDPSHYSVVRITVRATGDGTATSGSSVIVRADVALRNNLLR
jgi:type II secretory pathway pseudopilin PulG